MQKCTKFELWTIVILVLILLAILAGRYISRHANENIFYVANKIYHQDFTEQR